MEKLKNVLPLAIPEHRQYVPDWKELLPEGSLWTPGSQGKPDCKVCMGMGWVRLDVPTWDKRFGQLQFCSCVPKIQHDKLAYENSKGYRPVSKVQE